MQVMTLTCRDGHDSPFWYQFCGTCGSSIALLTAQCRSGHRSPLAQAYCGECGEELPGTHPGALTLPHGAVVVAPPESRQPAQPSELLTVRLIGKTYRPAAPSVDRYSASMAFSFSFANNTDRDIRAFTGNVRFEDLFGRDKLGVTLTVDTSPLSAGAQVVNDDYSIELNQFNDSHNWLIGHELSDMNVTFLVSAIIFADGQKVNTNHF